MDQKVRIETDGLKAIYRFAVKECDNDKVKNKVDLACLAINYLNHMKEEISFFIADNRPRGKYETLNELKIIYPLNEVLKKMWFSNPKNLFDLRNPYVRFTNSKIQDFNTLTEFISNYIENYDKDLSTNTTYYIQMELDINLVFKFNLDKKEKLTLRKISVLKDWEKLENRSVNRFFILFNGTIIPATEIIPAQNQTDLYPLKITLYSDKTFEIPVNVIECGIENTELIPKYYHSKSLPYFKEIFSLIKNI